MKDLNIFKKIEVKDNERLFFCSDIHGEIDFLLSSLNSLNFNVGKDKLIHAGDLIDRGTQSLKTANFFVEDTTGSFFSIIGNHDLFAIEQDYNSWFFNGGQWILDDLPTEEDKIEFANKISKLPFILEVNKGDTSVGITHACVPYEFESWSDFVNFAINNTNKGLLHEVVWQREFVECKDDDFYKNAIVLGVDFTVHGHTPVKEPLLVGNRWHIDTGLVYEKYLTIAELVNNELVFHKFKKENNEGFIAKY